MPQLPELANILSARERVYRHAVPTPLVRLQTDLNGPGEIYLKLENLQPIGSFKIRGAANLVEQLSAADLRHGLWTASMGNMAQGVAYCARAHGTASTVIVPDVAPANKIAAIERLGARVVTVSFDEWWRTFRERTFPGMQGTFIHAFDDIRVMEGNGTIATEILDQMPDVDTVIVPWGGGGLACGIAAAFRALRPQTKVYAAEVATAAPLSKSLQAGSPVVVGYTPSFVDGIGAKTVFADMFDRAKILLDGSFVAALETVAAAVKTLAERNHIVAEGAGACPVACALQAQLPGKVVCIVSGGNINTAVLWDLLK